MIELTWVADALRVGGLLFVLVYYGAAALLIYKAARWEKPLWQKAAVLAVVVIAFGYLPVSGYLEQRERRSYAKAAWDRFNKYCAEKAGAKISKTVSNVESILIYAPAVRRPDLTFMKGDPFAGRRQASEEQIAGAFLESGMSSIGFRRLFNSVEVERPDKPGETTIVKFESTPNGKIKQVNTRPPAGELGLYEVPEYSTTKKSLKNPLSKYGLRWRETSTDDDLIHWIASEQIEIVELTTQTTLGLISVFTIDPLLGSVSGRDSWSSAFGMATDRGNSCPTPKVVFESILNSVSPLRSE